MRYVIFIIFMTIYCNILYATDNSGDSKNTSKANISKTAKKPEVIDITANSFKSVGNTTTITGNVKIKKGSDLLNSDKAVVFTDKNRTPIYYEASGNVTFVMITSDNRELHGSGNRLVYEVKTGQYKLYDNAVVKEKGKSNVIRGDEIILSNDGEYANVAGKSAKPARAIFSLSHED